MSLPVRDYFNYRRPCGAYGQWRMYFYMGLFIFEWGTRYMTRTFSGLFIRYNRRDIDRGKVFSMHNGCRSHDSRRSLPTLSLPVAGLCRRFRPRSSRGYRIDGGREKGSPRSRFRFRWTLHFGYRHGSRPAQDSGVVDILGPKAPATTRDRDQASTIGHVDASRSTPPATQSSPHRLA